MGRPQRRIPLRLPRRFRVRIVRPQGRRRGAAARGRPSRRPPRWLPRPHRQTRRHRLRLGTIPKLRRPPPEVAWPSATPTPGFIVGHIPSRGIPRHLQHDGVEGHGEGRKLRSPLGHGIVHGLAPEPVSIQMVEWIGLSCQRLQVPSWFCRRVCGGDRRF